MKIYAHIAKELCSAVINIEDEISIVVENNISYLRGIGEHGHRPVDVCEYYIRIDPGVYKEYLLFRGSNAPDTALTGELNRKFDLYAEDNWHREDGPTIIWKSGYIRWYLEGEEYTFEEWCEKLDKTDEEIALLKLKYGAK